MGKQLLSLVAFAAVCFIFWHIKEGRARGDWRDLYDGAGPAPGESPLQEVPCDEYAKFIRTARLADRNTLLCCYRTDSPLSRIMARVVDRFAKEAGGAYSVAVFNPFRCGEKTERSFLRRRTPCAFLLGGGSGQMLGVAKGDWDKAPPAQVEALLYGLWKPYLDGTGGS